MAEFQIPEIGDKNRVAQNYAGMIEDRLQGLSTFDRRAAINAISKDMATAFNLDAGAFPTIQTISAGMVEKAVSPRELVNLTTRARGVAEYGSESGYGAEKVVRLPSQADRDEARKTATVVRQSVEGQMSEAIQVNRQQQR